MRIVLKSESLPTELTAIVDAVAFFGFRAGRPKLILDPVVAEQADLLVLVREELHGHYPSLVLSSDLSHADFDLAQTATESAWVLIDRCGRGFTSGRLAEMLAEAHAA